jgi:hypothetical protein
VPSRLSNVTRGQQFCGWCADVARAYGLGIIVGGPVGFAASWLSRGRADVIVTVTILSAMVVVLVVRRARRARP